MSQDSILIVDDEVDAQNLLAKICQKEGLLPVTVDHGERAVKEIRKKRFSLVLLDYQLPGLNGIEVLKQLLIEDPEVCVIMVTSHGSIKLAVEAVRLGAQNFIEKPFDLDEVRIILRNALEKYHVKRENSQLKEILRDDTSRDYILGRNSKMTEIWSMVKKVSSSEVPILIEGESGTGKEVIARNIHQSSLRKIGPFVAVNCGALSSELIESELFGHVKGAFTGAIATKKGRFELADGGTLFLDEIGEIQVGLQAKLLRVLQEKTFERVGDEKTRQVDVRIISATNRDVLKEIKSGKFREDLYYRLNVVNIKIPPLRERPEDIPELVEFFMGQFSVQRGQGMFRISPDALRFLQTYNFPGNIRELRNILERSCLLCSDQRIEKSDITPGISPRDISDSDPSVSVPGQGSETPKFSLARNQFEIGYLTRLLSVTRGNVSQASRLAGIDRNNFKDKLRKHGIVLEEFKEDFSED